MPSRTLDVDFDQLDDVIADKKMRNRISNRQKIKVKKPEWSMIRDTNTFENFRKQIVKYLNDKKLCYTDIDPTVYDMEVGFPVKENLKDKWNKYKDLIYDNSKGGGFNVTVKVILERFKKVHNKIITKIENCSDPRYDKFIWLPMTYRGQEPSDSNWRDLRLARYEVAKKFLWIQRKKDCAYKWTTDFIQVKVNGQKTRLDEVNQDVTENADGKLFLWSSVWRYNYFDDLTVVRGPRPKQPSPLPLTGPKPNSSTLEQPKRSQKQK